MLSIPSWMAETPLPQEKDVLPPKRKRGRPRKNPLPTANATPVPTVTLVQEPYVRPEARLSPVGLVQTAQGKPTGIAHQLDSTKGQAVWLGGAPVTVRSAWVKENVQKVLAVLRRMPENNYLWIFRVGTRRFGLGGWGNMCGGLKNEIKNRTYTKLKDLDWLTAHVAVLGTYDRTWADTVLVREVLVTAAFSSIGEIIRELVLVDVPGKEPA